MADLRSALDGVQRQVRARPDALEQVRARHHRRQRTRRLARLGLQLAVVVVVAAFGLMFGLARLGQPSAAIIGADTAQRLAPAWQLAIDGGGASDAVAADGTVYVATDDGTLRAIDAATGSTRWTGHTEPGPHAGPAVGDGMVLVQTAGMLYAYAADCAVDGATCAPAWSAETGGGTSQRRRSPTGPCTAWPRRADCSRSRLHAARRAPPCGAPRTRGVTSPIRRP